MGIVRVVSSDCLDAVFVSVDGVGLVVGGCGGLPPPPPPPPRSARKEEGSPPLPPHIPQRFACFGPIPHARPAAKASFAKRIP